MKTLLLQLFIFLSLTGSLCGHAADQILGAFSLKEAGGWEIRYTLDIAYAEGDWEDLESPQKPRSYLVEMDVEKMELLKQQALKVLADAVVVEPGGYELSLPDFETDPPDYPKLLNGGAYLTVLMSGDLPKKGPLLYQLRPDVEMSFILKKGASVKDEAYLTLWGGDEAIELFSAEETSAAQLAQSLKSKGNTATTAWRLRWILPGGAFFLIGVAVYWNRMNSKSRELSLNEP